MSYVHFDDVIYRGSSELAVLVCIGGYNHWIPKSQLAPGEAEKLAKFKPGEEGLTLSVTEWVVKEKGIEVD